MRFGFFYELYRRIIIAAQYSVRMAIYPNCIVFYELSDQ